MSGARGKLSALLRNERGSSLVEYSIVVLMVLTVLLGTVEVGRFILDYEIAADAARAGARYAIVNGIHATTPQGYQVYGNVTTQVNNILNLAGITNTASAPVNYPSNNGTAGTGNSTGNAVVVTVQYNFVPIPMTQLSFLTLTLTSQSEGIVCY